MATRTRRANAAPARHPEKKFGPFHGGVGLAIWLNQVETSEGTRWFRSISIQSRRYRDKKTGAWKDAKSLRPTDLPALLLAMDAAMSFMASVPLPGQPADDDSDTEALADGELAEETSAT